MASTSGWPIEKESDFKASTDSDGSGIGFTMTSLMMIGATD